MPTALEIDNFVKKQAVTSAAKGVSASAIDDFVKSQNTVSGATSVTSSDIDKILGKETKPFVSKGPVAQPTPSATQHPLRWAGAQLAKPGNILANITEPIGKALVTGDTSGFKDIPKNVWDVATGKSTRGYMEMVQEAMPDSPILGTVAGLGVSLIADPLNVIGGGLTKLGKLAETVQKITKAGEAIQEGSKLWKAVQASGKTVEELARIGELSKAGQAQKGARAFLKMGDIPLLPAKVSENIYKVTGKTGEIIGKIPVGRRFVDGVSEPVRLGEVVTKVKTLFSTSSGNEAFDAFRQKMTDLGDYRAAAVMDEAKAMYNIMY
jgi:hypothetical protein